MSMELDSDKQDLFKKGIVRDLSSADYHGLQNVYSSSQIKDALDDIEYFHKKYITKQIERVETPAFDVGTYFHTAILEPHKLQEECVVFSGVRRGHKWEQFKLDNKNKAIITEAEHVQAKGIIEAVQNSPVAMTRIQKGEPEVSGFLNLSIDAGQVYVTGKKMILGPYGWERADYLPDNKRSLKIGVKVRADLIGPDFILDLKSTSGNAKSEFQMRQSVSKYNYDLSAALYLDVFSAILNKRLTDFIWTFASKDTFNSRSYLASENNIRVGRAKWKKAILNIAKGIKDDWTFEDSLGILEPQSFELDYLRNNSTKQINVVYEDVDL